MLSAHRFLIRTGIICLAASLLVAAVPANAQHSCAVLERVSVASDGSQANGGSGWTNLSADGRYVAFWSNANTLVPDDTNSTDVFVRDRQTGTTERVSVASNGAEGNAGSYSPNLSAGGRFVAFWSDATNLVPDDTNVNSDVFLHDRSSGFTELISVATDGTQGNGWSVGPSVSADGRVVAFRSSATNLVPDDTNNREDVFVHDRLAGTTERVSVASGGAQANDSNGSPSLSANGRFVAFWSSSTNLVGGDTNAAGDVFVHDRATGSTERVSVATGGAQGNAPSLQSRISADGRFVAFESWADNLVPGDTNAAADVFVHDRQTGTTERVSVASDGTQGTVASAAPSISADGRFVGFHSLASNLVPGDTNLVTDAFVHDRQTGSTTRVSVAFDGAQGDGHSYSPGLSGDGRYVAFESWGINLVPGDTNAFPDAFVADNCLASSPPGAPEITWVTPPPATAAGGVDPIFLQWELAGFDGPITENQAHFGITSVLGSSALQPGANGVHAFTFAAPNVGTFDSPETYAYIIRALGAGAQVLSPVALSVVSAGPAPPTVDWVTPPPASVPSGGQFTASWALSDYVDPVAVNACGCGITSILLATPDQPGGNGQYTATVSIPAVSGPGTLFCTAYAQNPIEFAFAPILPVQITVP